MAADVSNLLKICVVLVISLLTFAEDEALYSPNDKVTILNSTNFESLIFHKEHGWLIEFYNKWCGHCVRFAPTWKELGKNVAGWGGVFKIAAIDCSDKGNLITCREYNISGYPTIKIFPPYIGKNDGGAVYEGNREIHHFEEHMVNYTMSHKKLFSKTAYNALTPLKSLGDIWDHASSPDNVLVALFEEEESCVGAKVVLDLLNYPNLVIRRMLRKDVEKFVVKKFPSLYLIDKGGLFTKLAEGVEREDMVRAVKRYMGEKSVELREEVAEDFAGEGNNDESVQSGEVDAEECPIDDPGPCMSEPPAVHMQDLESALVYSLRQEIASYKTISGDKLRALKHYTHVLAQYFPGQKPIRQFLRNLDNIMEVTTSSLSGDTWSETLRELETPGYSVLPTEDSAWVGCKGSEAKYRGYPCGLWTLFHTLTVSAVQIHEGHENDNDMDPHEVLNAMKGYIANFFGCEECSKNFAKMAHHIEYEVRSAKQSVLFLWSAHNKANKRLHGDLTEDPKHPKIQFPSKDVCEKCYVSSTENAEWSGDAVYEFLMKFYGEKDIVQDSPVLEYNEAEDLSDEEIERRKKDMEKIRQLREEKQINQAIKFQEAKSTIQLERLNPKILNLKRREMETRMEIRPVSFGWSGVDLSLCVMFYVVCAAIVLYLYFHFTVRRRMSVKGICASLNA